MYYCDEPNKNVMKTKITLFLIIMTGMMLSVMAQYPGNRIPQNEALQSIQPHPEEGIAGLPWSAKGIPAPDYSKHAATERMTTFFRPSLPTVSMDSLINSIVSKIDADSLKQHILGLEAFVTRFMLAPNHRFVAESIRQKFLSYGCDEAVLDSFEIVVGWQGVIDTTWQYNVIGTMHGSSTPGIQYLIGGHYDDIIWQGGDPMIYMPGADDNGSSIAAIYEVLRVFQEKSFRPKTTVKFAAFFGEELGLIGSYIYSYIARMNNDPLKMIVNLDMIGTERSASNWKVKLYKYSNDQFATDMAEYATKKFTILNPVIYNNNAQGSDSYSFFYMGFTPVYFEEFDFSPNWHLLTDTDTNMNFAYFKETTKAACATLLLGCNAPSTVHFAISDPGNGNTLGLSWNKNPENDIAGYRIRTGRSSGQYDHEYFTTDTTYQLTGLMKDSTYYIAVSGENTDGYEGVLSEDSDAPALVTLNQGILIVEDSKGSLNNDPDSVISSFYNGLAVNYHHAYYNAHDAGKIGLPDMAAYNAVIWHCNKSGGTSVFSANQREVKQYLDLGGKVLFSVYQPTAFLEGTIAYPISFAPGTFIYDYAKIDSVTCILGSAFNKAVPAAAGYPALDVDSSKVPPENLGHMLKIEGLHSTLGANAIYKYGSGFDSTTTLGIMKNQPVGMEYLGTGSKVITLSFPLYYMKTDQAKALTEYVMHDKFGVFQIGMDEKQDKPAAALSMKVYPNPSDGRFTAEVEMPVRGKIEIRIIDLLGSTISATTHEYVTPGLDYFYFEGSNLRPGIYFVVLESSSGKITRKVSVTR